MLHGLHYYLSFKHKSWLWVAGQWAQGLPPASYLDAQTRCYGQTPTTEQSPVCSSFPPAWVTRRLSHPQQVTVLIHGSASPRCLAMQLLSPGFPHLHTVPEAKTTPARECTGPRKATSFDEDLSNLFDLTSLTKEPFKEDELFHVAAISHVNQKDFFLTAATLYPFPTKLFILIQLSSSLQWTPLCSIFQRPTDTLFNLNVHILFSLKRGVKGMNWAFFD